MAKTKKKKTVEPEPKVEPVERLEWSVEPREERLSTALCHAWETKDGRYQVLRMESIGLGNPVFGAQYKRGKSWDIFEHDVKQGPGYPRYRKSLEEALVSVEIYHLKKSGKDTVKTNTKEVLAYAHKLGLDGMKVKTIAAPTVDGGEAPKPRTPRKREGGMSGVDAAFQILCDEGRPMDLKEMVKLMSERGYWTSPGGATPDRTIGAALGQCIKKGDARFVKTGRGMFQANK